MARTFVPQAVSSRHSNALEQAVNPPLVGLQKTKTLPPCARHPQVVSQKTFLQHPPPHSARHEHRELCRGDTQCAHRRHLKVRNARKTKQSEQEAHNYISHHIRPTAVVAAIIKARETSACVPCMRVTNETHTHSEKLVGFWLRHELKAAAARGRRDRQLRVSAKCSAGVTRTRST